MEACATAHWWGRAIELLGNEVRLVPPVYVKPFVRRQKNDAADAEAIAEAASRPSMRFVAVKTEEQQAQAMLFRTRNLLVRQRTQLVNALRGHLAEHGVVAPQGLVNVKRLAAAIDGSTDDTLPWLIKSFGQRFSILSLAWIARSLNSKMKQRRLPPRTADHRRCMTVVRWDRFRHRCATEASCLSDGRRPNEAAILPPGSAIVPWPTIDRRLVRRLGDAQQGRRISRISAGGCSDRTGCL